MPLLTSKSNVSPHNALFFTTKLMSYMLLGPAIGNYIFQDLTGHSMEEAVEKMVFQLSMTKILFLKMNFNLRNDPKELNNIINDHPEIVRTIHYW